MTTGSMCDSAIGMRIWLTTLGFGICASEASTTAAPSGLRR